MKRVSGSTLLVALLFCGGNCNAQDEAALAKQLANPVAALVSVPIQL